MQFYPGDKIDCYEILDYLASGGYGSVYKAKDLNEEKIVALKVMESGGNQEQRQERFAREVDILSSLRHNNIVSYYKSGTEEVEWYTMELLQGPSLQKVMEEDWPLHRKVDVLRQVAQALSYMHDQGFIHRDIKPQNIMFRTAECKEVVVFDMGLVHAPHSSLTLGHQILGTPSYLSPEQMDGNYEYKQIDIWAVGIIMFQWLTKSHPFLDATSSSSATEIMHSIKHSSSVSIIQKLAPIDFYLAEVCNKCLAKEVEERYSDGRELENVLGQWQMVHYKKCLEDAEGKKNEKSINEAIDLVESAYLWQPGDTVVMTLKDLWEKKLKRQDIRLLPKERLESAQQRLKEKGLELIVKETRHIHNDDITITPQDYVVCIQKEPKNYSKVYIIASVVASVVLIIVILLQSGLFKKPTENNGKVIKNNGNGDGNGNGNGDGLVEATQQTGQEPTKVLVKMSDETPEYLLSLLQDANPYLRVYAVTMLQQQGSSDSKALIAMLPNSSQQQQRYLFSILQSLEVSQEVIMGELKGTSLYNQMVSQMGLTEIKQTFLKNPGQRQAILQAFATSNIEKHTVVETLVELWHHPETSPEDKAKVMEVLVSMKPSTLKFCQEEMLNSRDRYNVFEILKNMGQTPEMLLLGILQNPKATEENKKRATTSLKNSEQQAIAMVSQIIDLLGTENYSYAYDILNSIRSSIVPDLLKNLDNQNEKIRTASMQLLSQTGPKMVAKLLEYPEAQNIVLGMGKQALPSLLQELSNPNTQKQAAKVLLAMPDVLPDLLQELRQSEQPKQLKSAIYLIAKQNFSEFLKLLKDQSPYVKEQAADIIARIGSPAIPYLIKILEDPTAVSYATKSLAKMESQTVLPYLLKALKEQANKTAILEILAEIGPQASGSINDILPLLSSDSRDVRQAAQNVLVKMQQPAPLIAGLAQESIRNDIVAILQKMGNVAVPELIQAMDNPQQKVRIYAIVTIRKMGIEGKQAIGKLVQILKQEQDQQVYVQAISALDAMQPITLQALTEVLSSSRTQTQIDICILLGNMGAKAKTSLRELEDLQKNSSSEVRKAADEALQKIRQGMLKEEVEKWHEK